MGRTAPLPQRGGDRRCFFGEAPVAADELEDAQLRRVCQPAEDLCPRHAAPTGPGGLLPHSKVRRAGAGSVSGRGAVAAARAVVPGDANGFGAGEHKLDLGGVGRELGGAVAAWGLHLTAE
jgi:hypothetical protein